MQKWTVNLDVTTWLTQTPKPSQDPPLSTSFHLSPTGLNPVAFCYTGKPPVACGGLRGRLRGRRPSRCCPRCRSITFRPLGSAGHRRQNGTRPNGADRGRTGPGRGRVARLALVEMGFSKSPPERKPHVSFRFRRAGFNVFEPDLISTCF